MGATLDLEMLDRIVRQMHGVYWIVDLELRIVATGGAIEEILGFPADQNLGRTLYDVHRTDGGTHDPIGAHLRALAGETVPLDNEFKNKLLQCMIAPYREDGEIVGAIGTAIDQTTTRMLERRMVDAQRAESLGVLAGGLAHDFNNLLVAILGNAELALRDGAAGPGGQTLLENIRDAALRAGELTEQLLAYAGRRVTTTRLAIAPMVAELLRISQPAQPADVSFVVDIPAELAARGDPSQVRQVVLNLIANAREALAGRRGTITLSGRVVRHDGLADPDDIVPAAAGPYVAIEVRDDGPGIDREARRRIFEPFFTTKPTGHGLGLASVVGIVRSHAGGLRLVSSPGTGACFQVLLPATLTPPRAITAVEAPTRTVLVIDDEDLVREVVARMIEDLGYAAITAADGPAGLALVERQPIDLVLVDQSMPTMSGSDVISALRLRRPTLPVVLCSGYDRGRLGVPVSADAYLPKPFRLDALEQTLAKILG